MITRKLAKAILRSPNYGEVHDADDIAWVKNTVYVWPSCQPTTEINIYRNDELVEAHDLSWIRRIANG